MEISSMYYFYLSNLYYQNYQNYQNYIPTSDENPEFKKYLNYDIAQNFYDLQPIRLQAEPPIKNIFCPLTLKMPQDSLKCKVLVQKNCQKINQKNCSKKNKVSEIDYVPSSKQAEKKSNVTYLNEYRNILPNTIHQILSYIQRKNKSKIIIQKMIRKYSNQNSSKNQSSSSTEISVGRFYAFQNQLKNKLSNYVTLETFKTLCTDSNIEHESQIISVQQQKIYNKISRVAILYYLNYEVIPVLMYSKRMQKDKKRQHLKINRQIENYIRNGFHDYDNEI